MGIHVSEPAKFVKLSPTINRRSLLIGAGATLGAAGTTAAAPSPQQRIDAAIEEIQSALAEQYPNWTIEARHDVVRERIDGDAAGDPFRAGILIFASENRCGAETARWFVEYV